MFLTFNAHNTNLAKPNNFLPRSKSNPKPKNKIYKNFSENSVNEESKDNRDENKFPLINQNDESYDEPVPAHYLEPTQRFPIPSTPMLATARQLSNIRTNPHIRLTQV